LPEAAPHVRAVRICAIINLTAIGSVLSWAIAETLDPLLVFTGYWFLFLILLLLPYGAIIWLIDTGRPRNGLILAGAWGPVAAFAPLSWSVVSPNIGHYWTPSPPGMFLLLLSLLMIPFHVWMANAASKALAALEAGHPGPPALGRVVAVCYGLLFVAAVSGGPALLPHRRGIASTEAATTGNIRMLNIAESTYSEQYRSFSDTLTKLCPPATGGQATKNSADLLDAERCGATSKESRNVVILWGYIFSYAPIGRIGEIRRYSVHADPIFRGRSGQRSLYADESGIIRSNSMRSATASDSPI